jgi:hypothetical protein
MIILVEIVMILRQSLADASFSHGRVAYDNETNIITPRNGCLYL